MILEPDLIAFLQDQSMAAPGEEGRWTPLSGGVSSDIWRVDTSVGSFCVKRALARLKVDALWEAPVDRNAYEWAYLETVSHILPGAVPRPIAHDPQRGLFAMAWLQPDQYPLWKDQLLAGEADAAVAQSLGDMLGRIHAATAADPSLPSRFATDANFHQLRLDPYLLEAGRRHSDLSPRLRAIADQTASTRRVLVHGDVSPKNILVGAKGPVLLDAEVAWFGDPAFDLAFCLNHLIIKARFLPASRATLSACFDALAAAYLDQVNWEPVAGVEHRAAQLLPALALARVDGKSPVEYLDDRQRETLRTTARAALQATPRLLADAKAVLLQDPV